MTCKLSFTRLIKRSIKRINWLEAEQLEKYKAFVLDLQNKEPLNLLNPGSKPLQVYRFVSRKDAKKRKE